MNIDQLRTLELCQKLLKIIAVNEQIPEKLEEGLSLSKSDKLTLELLRLTVKIQT